MALCAPVIVVPGITASALSDAYPLPPETVWSVLKKEYERVSMHPDNVRYEAREPAKIGAGQVFEIAYRELVEELRHNLGEKEDQPVPVYTFPYDWRQPLDDLETALAAFIEEVIERTKLMRHYHRAGYSKNPKVNLVGHSMGGLLIAGYLESRGKEKRVAKVATLATPFRGSFEAVVKLATGTAELGNSAPSSREREAARATPGVYHLLPTCPGLEVDTGLPKQIFNIDLWQPSILETLEEYVRLHAIGAGDRKTQARNLFLKLLQFASKHRRRIDQFQLRSAGLAAKDWLCVVGVDSVTRVKLKVAETPKGPEFKLRSTDRMNLWNEGTNDQERRLTGDGTVPFEGALPGFLKLENVVCVGPDDFGYWEVQDRVTSKVAGFHGILPNMDMLHRLIVRHFTGRPDQHRNTWGRRAPGVVNWQPPLKLDEETKVSDDEG